MIPMNGMKPSPLGNTLGMCDDGDRFLDDPLLPALYRGEQDDYFSLGLIVNWPTEMSDEIGSSSSPLHSPFNANDYERFLSAVKSECFQGKTDFLFCMPFYSLHITVATLFTAHHTSELPRQEWRSLFLKEWKEVLLRASSSKDWPKDSLELELHSAQIGNRAGILLWKEHSGGIEKMRQCLEIAVKELSPSSMLATNLQEHLRIPNIIHTTFARYHHSVGAMKTTASDSGVPLRPSQAHSILVERIVPNHPFFSSDGMDIDENNQPIAVGNQKSCRSGSARSLSKKSAVSVNCANFVNCKIYLQGAGKEEDHDIYLRLPLRDAI